MSLMLRTQYKVNKAVPVGHVREYVLEITCDEKGREMRVFDSGAMRDDDAGKIDPDGFLSPEVLEAFFAYMQKHQTCADGNTRASDNWKASIPPETYIKSLWRHFFEAWTIYRGRKSRTREEFIDSLCAILFNTQGLLHEVLKEKGDGDVRGVSKEVRDEGEGERAGTGEVGILDGRNPLEVTYHWDGARQG